MLALENLEVPLYLRRIMSSYLADRTLLYDTDDEMLSYNITGGVPQGLIVGSQFWDLLYDGLLRQPLPDEVSMVAYATIEKTKTLLILSYQDEEVRHLYHRKKKDHYDGRPETSRGYCGFTAVV